VSGGLAGAHNGSGGKGADGAGCVAANKSATGRLFVSGFLVRIRDPMLPLLILPSILVSSLATFKLPLRERAGECGTATLATYHAFPAEREGDLASLTALMGDAEAVRLERRLRGRGLRGALRVEGAAAAGKYARSPVES